jgi:hypothetical protein
MLETTSTNAVTVSILPNGETHLSSSSPWYRLFKAIADLFLAGAIDTKECYEMLTPHISRWADDGEFECPAAKQVYGSLMLAFWEPKCGHDFYKGCDCPELTDDDRRARVRELMYAA